MSNDLAFPGSGGAQKNERLSEIEGGRHDLLQGRYEGGGRELNDREMSEYRDLHRRHTEFGRDKRDSWGPQTKFSSGSHPSLFK